MEADTNYLSTLAARRRWRKMWAACSMMVEHLVMKDMKKVDLASLWEEAVGKKACSAWGRFGPRADLDFV